MINRSPAEPAVMEVDPISTLLHGTYLPNWTAAEMNLGSPWGLSVPSQRGCLYVVLKGGGWFKPTDESIAPIRLTAGDHLITTRGMPHQLLSDLNATSVAVDALLGEPRWLHASHGHAGVAETRIERSSSELPNQEVLSLTLDRAVIPDETGATSLLYGQFDLSEIKQNPLDIGLPDVIHLNHQRDNALAFCLPMLAMIQAARLELPSGWNVIVRRLAELILLQTVAVELNRRAHEPSDSESGAYRMLRAATDSVIGPVLKVMVDTPEAPWTVPQMARMANVSKSAFSERFRRMVGLPPLQYLTEIRMGKSRRLLRDSEVEVGEIAFLVGYESPSSFSNVFKRWHGVSPVEYRRKLRAQPQEQHG